MANTTVTLADVKRFKFSVLPGQTIKDISPQTIAAVLKLKKMTSAEQKKWIAKSTGTKKPIDMRGVGPEFRTLAKKQRKAAAQDVRGASPPLKKPPSKGTKAALNLRGAGPEYRKKQRKAAAKDVRGAGPEGIIRKAEEQNVRGVGADKVKKAKPSKKAIHAETSRWIDEVMKDVKKPSSKSRKAINVVTNIPKEDRQTTIAKAKERKHLYYWKDGKTKMAAVTREDLKKSGLKDLTAYMNKKLGLSKR